MMRRWRVITLLLLPLGVCGGQERVQPGTLARSEGEITTEFRISLVAYAVARSADIGVSYWQSQQNPRLVEANPFVLGLSDGRWTGKTVAVQAGVTAGTIALEWLVVRKWPKAQKWLKWINWGMSATHSVAVVHNMRLGK